MQSKVVACSCSSASVAVATASDAHVVDVQQLADAVALAFVVFDHQHAAQAL